MSSTPQTRRVARGRGHSYVLDGLPVDGVTKVTGDGVPKRAFVSWAQRTVAGYAIDHWDELVELAPSERYRRLERAAFAERDEAAGRGREVHAIVERMARGEAVEVPEPLEGLVDSYLRFADEWIAEDVLAEAVVVNRAAQPAPYMGTLDSIARLVDGRLWLLDWKTGGSGVWPEVALQLAAYRYAEAYLDADGVERPLPEVEACGALWIRPDGFDLYPVAVTPATFRTFRYAQVMAEFVRAPREETVGDALAPPAPPSSSSEAAA